MIEFKKLEELSPKEVSGTKVLREKLNKLIANQNILMDIVSTIVCDELPDVPEEVLSETEDAPVKIKALDLAKELNIEIAVLKSTAKNIEIEIKSHLSNVEEADAEAIRKELAK